ncbi:MAG: helix-turn-helix domain-containing protein [Alphaproteobacteria bacterium]
MPNIAQIRAARALLDWSQADLADQAGLSQTGIARIENGTNKPNSQTLEKICMAFENADIEFLGEAGVRKKSGDIKTLRGQEGFRAFMEDVYKILKGKGGDVCVYNVDEKNWIKWMGDSEYKAHAEKIRGIKEKINFRIIIEEGDWYFIASDFAKYRWFPKDLFKTQSFYAYGTKLGLINFTNDNVEILVLDQKDFAGSFKILFDIAWDYVAKKPEK